MTATDTYSPATDAQAERMVWRCHRCRRYLGTVLVRMGWAQIEVRCSGCGTINALYVTCGGRIDSEDDGPAL